MEQDNKQGFRLLTSVCSALPALVGCVVLVGWPLKIEIAKSVLPGLATMKFNTALCFVLLGLALWLLRDEESGRSKKSAGYLCAVIVVIIAALSLCEYSFGWKLGIDELFVADPGTDPTFGPPGRMSAATGQCFVFLGLSLLLLNVDRGRRRPAQYFAAIGTLAGLIGCLGYLYGIQALYSFFLYSSMALHTSALFVVLGLGVLSARPESGLMAVLTSNKVGGALARRILPWAVFLCIIIGWLRLKGERAGHFNTETGTAMIVVLIIAVISVTVWLAARSLNQLHVELDERNLANARFAAIVDSSVDAIIGKDLNSIVTTWNKGAEAILGYAAEEMIGQSVTRIIPPDRLAEEQDIITRIRRGERVEHFETVRQHKNGRLIHVSVSISPIKDANDRVVGASKVARDITKRVQAEQALREAEKSIQLQAKDLARSNKDLEQFAYVASHDLQEPLRAVAGCLQVLQRRYQGKMDARADELIGHAVDGAHRMQSLIEGLLAFSRVGTRGGDFKPTSCNDALDNALKNLATAIQESGAVITRDELPTLNADPLQLALLLQNLIGNAIKFRREEPPRIHVGAQHKDGHWVITVKDNGIGIESQYFDRIFVIFQRLHTRNEYPGTGIGLALCRKIVERHGGHISVTSKSGQGSAFLCSFPSL